MVSSECFRDSLQMFQTIVWSPHIHLRNSNNFRSSIHSMFGLINRFSMDKFILIVPFHETWNKLLLCFSNDVASRGPAHFVCDFYLTFFCFWTLQHTCPLQQSIHFLVCLPWLANQGKFLKMHLNAENACGNSVCKCGLKKSISFS